LTISSLTPVEEKYTSVKQLIELGKEKGYLLYDEIYEMLPEEVVSLPDELDEIYIRFSDLGIDVIDRPERYQNRDDFDARAAERVEQIVEIFRGGDLRRQLLVDLVVQQVALLLANLNQLPYFVVSFLERKGHIPPLTAVSTRCL